MCQQRKEITMTKIIIDVYFQQCAWVDSEINIKWAQNTLKNGLKGDPAEKVLFADNVGFQQAHNFH